jgi:aspartate aminotransferase
MTVIDIAPHAPSGAAGEAFAARALNAMSQGMSGSTILRIAGEISAMQAEGRDVCNLTVGDFDPEQFPIPASLRDDIVAALQAGETNYPPAVGMPQCREAVRAMYERDLGLKYPVDSVIMGSGARPPIYATAALVLEPGDKVLYGVPSWNNHHYVIINRCEAVTVEADASTDFLLTAELIADKLDGVRLLALNSPLNPCGTAYTAEQLTAICDVVLAENERREAAGERPLMVMYDQVYWMLTFGATKHITPVHVRPAMAKYTIFVDAISKSFAATGLRIGWGVVPPALSGAYKALIGHMGAWAPRPGQVATAKLLQSREAIDAYQGVMLADVEARLTALHEGFSSMGREGLPVSSIAPQGAIYLSARFDVLGRTFRGRTLATDEDVRSFLLDEAGFGVVPFTAFGIERDTGWMRLSVGAVSLADIERGLGRIRGALAELG